MEQKKGLGIVVLVLGIVGFLTGFIGIGIIFDIIAIILGIIVIASKKQKSGLGIAGVVVASVGLVLMILFLNVFSDGKETSKSEIVENSTPSTDVAEESEPEESKEAETDSSVDTGNGTGSYTIEEQVLLDKDGLKIVATEIITDSIWGDGVKLLIENNTDTNLGVGCNALIVNNYMLNDLFSSTIAAGKKANETMYISSSQLKASGIDNVGQIEIYFHIYDADSYKTIYDADCVTIKTSGFDTMDTKALDDGKELINQNGVRIIGKYVDENSFWGASILLYIENKSGKNIGVNCENMSINGFMVSPLFSSTVYDSKMVIDDITILSSDLEKNNIEKVQDIELQFHVYDADSYSTIFDSDPVMFTVQ